jgi:hypothetical protein|tara:strand:- start:3305 stop:3565 length:261 start_codon:yes stop_codon:yes gene_type:complete
MFVKIITKTFGFRSQFFNDEGVLLGQMQTNLYPEPQEIIERAEHYPTEGCEECEFIDSRCVECRIYEDIKVQGSMGDYVIKGENLI